MSDTAENPRRRDRRRRNRNRDTGNNARQNPNQQSRKQTGRQAGSGQNAEKKRPRKVNVPEIPAPPKMPTPVCARCGEPIQDLAAALADKSTGNPVHFDCVLQFLRDAEKIGDNENLLYIGQGRFAVVTYDDPADKRKFTIVRQIEWEGRDARAEWRSEIAGHYSQVH